MIHPETRSVAGGIVTPLWASVNHLDLFAVTADRGVSTIWWDSAEPAGYNPAGWVPIAAQRQFQPGAKVAALFSPKLDVQHLDLFTVDVNGVVNSTWSEWPGVFQPEGWFQITGQEVTKPGGFPITASCISDKELLLLVSASDGTVAGANWLADPGWRSWFPIRGEFKGTPGAAVTAVLSPDPNHLDVFTTDPNGTVHSSYYRFNVNDTCVATAGSVGTQLEKIPAVLAIQGFIPEVFSDGDDIDRFEAKASYWSDWRSCGLPVFWDVSPGYDAHIVFPGSEKYGNNAQWRIYIQESWDNGFQGMVYNTWNGYTEGYAAMSSLEYGDMISNWVPSLFTRAK
jgi:hypothetical protein